MFLALAFIAVLMLAAGHFGMSRPLKYALLSLVTILILLTQITLPVGNPLRTMFSGSIANWLILIGLGAVVWTYAYVLSRLRRKAKLPEAVPKPGFSSEELERYARHIMLREIGGSGQRKLKQARILVVGAGGLGAPSLMYLAAAGVGTIGVIDDDKVSLSNLQRQIAFSTDQQGMGKVFAAQARLEGINPHVTVLPYHRRLTKEIACELFSDYHLVLDGSDNFATRRFVNQACVTTKTPLISGAIGQWEGQISLYDPASGGPCYVCVFPEEPAEGLVPSCAEAGVLGALPGVIGAMMAGESIKFITGAGQDLRGRLVIYDALYGESRTIEVVRRTGCPVCGATDA